MCASKMSSGSTTPSSTDSAKWYLSECKHNHFNHSRVKKGKAWLCCRDCGTKWRTPHPLRSLCLEFYETRGLCALGSSCPYLHVHRFKCTERSPTHIAYVGENRDDLLRECAIAVLTEYLPSQPFPRDVMPQIRALYEARRTAVNIPPVIHTAHFPAARMTTPHAAIAVETMHDQQRAEVNRAPTPPMPAKLIAPTLFPTGSVTGSNPVIRSGQRNGVMNSPPATARLLRVTARYVPIQRTLYEGRWSPSGGSLASENDTLDDGAGLLMI